MGALVEVQNLFRSFGPVQAVSNVTFTLDRGEILGFIGPNGAGKTTSMRILATLDVPTAGDAFIGGHSVVDYPDRVRQRIGFMPDAYGVYPHMTIEDYLDFFGRAYELRGARLRQTVERVMEFTGLDALAGKMIDALSKGMRQRLALGRMLLNDPDVLILDEPAAGLDPRARIEFRELVKLLAEDGKGILISSHILTELSEMVDGCLIIERGRLVAQGSVAEVRELARTRRAVTHQEIVMELVAADPGCERFLLEQPFVAEVHDDAGILRFTFDGDRDAAADLLARTIASGYRVMSFRFADTNLEDVFMAVTEGELQ